MDNSLLLGAAVGRCAAMHLLTGWRFALCLFSHKLGPITLEKQKKKIENMRPKQHVPIL
jgi:hypothetical protein